MFMLLLSGNRLNPDTFINVKSVYGDTITQGDEPVPVRQTYMTVICDGDAVPVRNIYGVVMISSEE
ncbi:hypothetical protein DRX19_11450 [Salmonella enterica subsp. enterica]|nr:hypothetical protein [Salmonella enterica subsp. enterica serovar Pensacola]